MNYFKITQDQISYYQRNGYIIFKNFLTTDESDKLADIALKDAVINKDIDTAKLAIQYGADVNLAIGGNFETLLMEAL